MAITFPRPMPLPFSNKQSFELVRVDFLSPAKSGRVQAVTAGQPMWMGRWSLAELDEAKSEEIRAWVSSLRGAQRLFIGQSTIRTRPRAYPTGTGYTAGPASWTQTVLADGTIQLTLTGLAAGQIVSAGDYVGFVWSGWKRALVRSLETATASAGGAASFAIEPAVPLVVPAGAAATLDDAGCLMRLTPDTQLGEDGLRRTIEGGTIVGVQDLIA